MKTNGILSFFPSGRRLITLSSCKSNHRSRLSLYEYYNGEKKYCLERCIEAIFVLRSVTFFDWVPPVSVVVGDQVEEGELSPEMEKDGLCKRSLSLFLSTLDFFFFFPGLSVLIIQLLIRARARRCGKGKAHHLEICQNGRRYITHMTDMFSMPARMSNRRRVPGIKKKKLKNSRRGVSNWRCKRIELQGQGRHHAHPPVYTCCCYCPIALA